MVLPLIPLAIAGGTLLAGAAGTYLTAQKIKQPIEIARAQASAAGYGAQTQASVTERTRIVSMLPGATAPVVAGVATSTTSRTEVTGSNSFGLPSWALPVLIALAVGALVFFLARGKR